MTDRFSYFENSQINLFSVVVTPFHTCCYIVMKVSRYQWL